MDLGDGDSTPIGLAAFDSHGALCDLTEEFLESDASRWLSARKTRDSVLAINVASGSSGAVESDARSRADPIVRAVGLAWCDSQSPLRPVAISIDARTSLAGLLDLPRNVISPGANARSLRRQQREMTMVLDRLESLTAARVPADVRACSAWSHIRSAVARASQVVHLTNVEASVNAVICGYLGMLRTSEPAISEEQFERQLPHKRQSGSASASVEVERRMLPGAELRNALAIPEPSANGDRKFLSIAEKAQYCCRRRAEGATYQVIGDEVGLTRERVRQLILRADGPDTTIARQARQHTRDVVLRDLAKRAISDRRENPGSTILAAAERLGTTDVLLRRCLAPEVLKLYVDPRKRSTALRKWTIEQMVAAIQEAATMAFPLTANDYQNCLSQRLFLGPSIVRIQQVFGSWLAACEAAGVEGGQPRRAGYSSRWRDDDLLAFVTSYLSEVESTGTFAGYDAWARGRDDAPSGQTLRNRLGSWIGIKKLALARLATAGEG